jgi:hypothetical protein
MHRFKYAQYIERVEASLKFNPRCFFKFANLKRNSRVLIHLPCFWVTLANLFGKYFQGVYVRGDSHADFVMDDGVEDNSTVSLIQVEEETMEWSILAL